MNKIKATLLRFKDLSWRDMCQLKSWSKRPFDVENLTSPSTRIAQATNGRGETVCYANVEAVMVVSGYAVNFLATPEDAQIAGDSIDKEIARAAQLAGISKVLILVPEDCPTDGEFKTIRVYERAVPQNTSLDFGYPSQAQATHQLLN